MISDAVSEPTGKASLLWEYDSLTHSRALRENSGSPSHVVLLSAQMWHISSTDHIMWGIIHTANAKSDRLHAVQAVALVFSFLSRSSAGSLMFVLVWLVHRDCYFQDSTTDCLQNKRLLTRLIAHLTLYKPEWCFTFIMGHFWGKYDAGRDLILFSRV